MSSQSHSNQLPALREDLRFMGRSKDVNGEPVWLIFDPLRNRYIQLRQFGYEIISRWGVGDAQKLSDTLTRETKYGVDVEDIKTFIAFLTQNQLIHRLSSPPLKPVSTAAKWHKALSSLVFFRLRLARPDRILGVMVDSVAFMFAPVFWGAIAALGVLGLYLVSQQWGQFVDTFAGFLDAQGAIVLVLAIIFSKFVHELGHALTAKNYGCRVPTMGLAFILGMPLAYTDVSDTWRLEKSAQRLKVSGGGILAETLLAVLATWGWLIFPDGPLRAACFILATTGWIGTLLINLNPFMRFDGYYILSDMLGIRNLQSRSFDMGKWGMRRALLGWTYPQPEKVSKRLRLFLMSFAWMTWLVRGLIFLGIAIMAYVMFGKTFGTLIGAFEVWLLLASPVVKELEVWIKKRREWLGQKRAKRSLLLITFLMIFSLIPQSFRLSMPAVLTPHDRLIVHAPEAALLVDFPKDMQRVSKGEVILQLVRPELEQDIEQSQQKLEIVELAIQQAAISQNAARQLNIFAQELAEEQARLDGLLEQRKRLSLTAPFDGFVTDIDPALSKGMWVSPDDPLFLLVNPSRGVLTAYIDDRDRSLIEVGSDVVFYPEVSDYPVREGLVKDVASVPLEHLEETLLASVNGGAIAVRKDESQRLIPEHGLYQVSVSMMEQGGVDIPNVLRGTAYADSRPYSLLVYGFNRVRSLFSKEMGI